MEKKKPSHKQKKVVKGDRMNQTREPQCLPYGVGY